MKLHCKVLHGQVISTIHINLMENFFVFCLFDFAGFYFSLSISAKTSETKLIQYINKTTEIPNNSLKLLKQQQHKINTFLWALRQLSACIYVIVFFY